jgi:plasmid stability protein
MAVLTIGSVPEHVHRALRSRAARHGRSTKAEVREILAASVAPSGQPGVPVIDPWGAGV